MIAQPISKVYDYIGELDSLLRQSQSRQVGESNSEKGQLDSQLFEHSDSQCVGQSCSRQLGQSNSQKGQLDSQIFGQSNSHCVGQSNSHQVGQSNSQKRQSAVWTDRQLLC